MNQQTRFDEMYFAICQETGGINGLLDSLFNFMYRRTDFYYEADPGDKMGFPPGQNVQILLNAFAKYQDEHYKTRAPKKDPKTFQEKLKQYKDKQQQQKEIDDQKKQKKQLEQQQNKNQLQSSQKNQEIKIEQEKISTQQEKQQISKQENNNSDIQTKQQQSQSTKIIREQEFNTYNGGQTDKYSWSQSIQDVSVQIQLPENTTKKQINVVIGNNSLSVQVMGQTIVKGELYLPVKVDDSLWSIEDGRQLQITLEKAQENIWKTVIKGDKEIDATKVENTKPLESFDGETQGAIRKIMYDQQRKQMGLPTSEEENQMDIMKKAWDAEGSPFKGQPFDPSKLNFQGQQLQ